MLRPGGRLAILEITQPRGVLRPFFSLWFDRIVPLLGKVLPGGKAYTYLPASVRRFPGAEELAAVLERQGFERGHVPLLGGDDRRAPRRGRRVSALETVRSAVGLAEYLDAVEARLDVDRRRASRHRRPRSGADALAAGGKRLRPTLDVPLVGSGRRRRP